ncbi:MAG: ankyrin repeat domain-containing protein [Planctomycetota bacterium]
MRRPGENSDKPATVWRRFVYSMFLVLLTCMTVSCTALMNLYLRNPADDLVECVDKRQYDKLKRLLSRGKDVNRVEGLGAGTALHAAVHNRDVKAAKLLVDSGADVNARGKFGQTPLDWLGKEATRTPELEIVTFLRKHGAKTSKELDEKARSHKSEVRDQRSEVKTQDKK